MPLLSVITPTYNRSKLLTEAIESVTAQTFDDYELLVVDDGSSDDTAAVVARFAEGQAPKRIRLFRQTNAGQGAARNRAIAEARGEYCIFLDDDDLFLPWSLATVAAAILENGRPSVLIGKELCFATAEEFAAAKQEPLRVTNWPDLYSYAAKNALGPCGIVVARTELLREIGGFLTESMVGEDADLMLRMGVAPRLTKMEAPWLYGYRRHSENFTLNGAKWHQGAVQFIRRYRQGAFPGGAERAKEIRRNVARATACYSLCTLRHGGRRNCFSVYVKTLHWQVLGKNYPYLWQAPLLLVLSALGLWPRKK